jgi:uncharacterized protein YegL
MVAPFDDIGDYFADNPEPRCACVLVADVSGSMHTAIAQLNDGLAFFKECIENDHVAALRTEVAVIAYDHEARLEHDFATVDQFVPPLLSVRGGTKISAGVNLALDLVEERKSVYREHGITYYRPWVWLLCDGRPEHDTPAEWQTAKARVQQAEEDNQVAFFVVGVGDGVDMQELNTIGNREALRLDGLDFIGMFQWLSSSMASVSQSQPGDSVALTDPTSGPRGWASV